MGGGLVRIRTAAGAELDTQLGLGSEAVRLDLLD